MKRKLVWTLSLLTASLCAQVAAPPKYKVAAPAHENEIVPLLNGLAEQGYRLVAIGPAAILKLEPPASGHYQYDLVTHQRDPDKFFKALNELGEQGYRWVPFSPLTEKSMQATKYRYLKAPHGQWGYGAKAPAISSAGAQGFRPVNVVYFEQIFKGQFELVLEQEAQSTKNTPLGPLEIVAAMREENVMKHVDELAKQGYRFVSPHMPNTGGGAVGLIMEKCAPSCGGPYEYHYFDAKNPAQAEQDLNALGKDGFRVVPSALRTKPHLLERDPNRKQTFSYRVLEAKDVAGLENAVNDADREGYEPLGYVGHIHMLVPDFYLVLEKPIAQAGTSR
jgi:hypothetical protein